MKISLARKITLALVALTVLVSFFTNIGSGNLSALGWKSIAYLCPLGALEAFLASWTFIPRQVIALGVCVLIVIVLGKVFCAWLCPVPPLRRFFTLKKDESVSDAIAESKKALEAAREEGVVAVGDAAAVTPVAAVATSDTTESVPIELSVPQACDAETRDLKACPSGCTSCTEQRKKFDSRHIVLGGALLSTAIFGFPVFCIICPVGLTFASLIALWRLVGFNEPSWALLIFPVFLALELFVLKKWCIKFCPLGALMSLMSIPNKLFKPRVDNAKCLRTQGIDCKVCVTVCEEELDPHCMEGMHECTKCGLCKEHCPSQAISIPLYAGKAAPVQDLCQDAKALSK
ncbi:MAG: 4Fe-4S binding protein [Eggerthellaceae bacterium]|jgi:ferredoxin-type protein NapH|nr:4Fe-4S binding protein [Eggerthellaceae bacterium]MDR2721402.1 4Fe-4S binding protein [Coriobacteriaceae bacterium]